MRADLLNAVRALRLSPSFTTVALVVLTLGIGATTAIFSVVDAIVLRNVPFDDPDRLVRVMDIDTNPDGFVGGHTTPQDYLDWIASQTMFEALAATTGGGEFTIRDGGFPERLRANRVTANLFAVLRVSPQVGRSFTAEHEVDGNHRVAVISHALWQRRFGGAADIVGRTMKFETGAWEILGVMPAGFEYPLGTARAQDLWVPYVVPATQTQRGNSRNYGLSVVGRLRPASTLAQGQQEMDAIQARVRAEFPAWNPRRVLQVQTLHESLVGRVSGWMLMLLAAVACVLIACVNVANLYLARATARVRDVGVRSALGASRWQLIRGFLVESFVLCAIGTMLGVLAAYWGIAAIKAVLPLNLPRVRDVGLDLRVLAAAAGAMVTTGVLCGLAPALQLTRPNLTGALRDGRANTAGAPRQRLRAMLVMAEVALAVVLLVGAGLFLSSFSRLTRIDIGPDYRNVLTVPVYPPFVFSDPVQRAAGMARAEQLVPQAIERVSALPGIIKVGAIANGLPLSGDWSRTVVSVPGSERTFESDADSVDIREVSPSYFPVMGIKVIAGRVLEAADRTGARVIVLNDVAARRYLGDRDPLGARININGERTVVGVVGSVRLSGPEGEIRPEAYRPFEPKSMFGADLVVRTAGDPAAAAPAVFAAIRQLAPDLVLGEVETLEGHYSRLIWMRRFNALLLSIFGALGIVITAVGIFGVMGYVVEQRTQEIGVRMALGARPGSVQGMVLRKAMAYVSVGLVLGLGGAWALSRYVQSFLFQIEPRDPLVYLTTVALLVGIGVLAAWLPSRRASKVDPIIALRT